MSATATKASQPQQSNVDAIVHAKWPTLSSLLAGHGLQARFVEGDAHEYDDVIEISRHGTDGEDDLGDIQIADDGLDYCVATWTSPMHEARRRGPLRTTVEEAFGDFIAYLKKDGLL